MNKVIQRRQITNSLTLTGDTLLDRIFSARKITDKRQLDRSLSSMLAPNFCGLDNAIQLLQHARTQQSRIIIVGDFDADGATSTALMTLALRQLGFLNVDYLIPNRFEQGYGLSLPIAAMAVAKGVDLLITVDNGIASVEGVQWLKQQGIKVIITDHHLPPETLPPADAIINPNLADCPFDSKHLAGVGVSFYVMLGLRRALADNGMIAKTAIPNFAQLLDLVALGTVADVVPLDQNNRILVHQGLQRINAGQCRTGIMALCEIANKSLGQLRTSDLGFSIAPRLNAAGRLDNMHIGVELLLTEDMTHARQLAYELDSLNQTRKEIEQGMKLEALKICQRLNHLDHDAPYGIVLYQADWHQGVLGILASRIKERFHRPTIAFALDQEDILKGSARSIEGLHIRDLLESLQQSHPNLILKFGGHAMAAGLSIRMQDLARFQQCFNQAVQQQLQDHSLTNIIWSDGELTPTQMTLETAETLINAAPWGQHFPEPLFDGVFDVLQQRLVGGSHLKLMLQAKDSTALFDGIAFNVDTQLYPDRSIKQVRIAYKLDVNEYRGQRQLQLLIEHIEPY